MTHSNLIAFPSRHLTVFELVNYWRWRGYRLSSSKRGNLLLWSIES